RTAAAGIREGTGRLRVEQVLDAVAQLPPVAPTEAAGHVEDVVARGRLAGVVGVEDGCGRRDARQMAPRERDVPRPAHVAERRIGLVIVRAALDAGDVV